MDERFVFQAFEQMGESVVKVKLINNKQSRWDGLLDVQTKCSICIAFLEWLSRRRFSL